MFSFPNWYAKHNVQATTEKNTRIYEKGCNKTKHQNLYNHQSNSMTKPLVLLISLLCSNFLYAQIQIIDSLTSEPIPYVHVKLVRGNKGTITNYNGYFELDSLFMEKDSIVISCIGYESKSYSLQDLISSSQITLSPAFQQVDEVNITKKKGKYKLKNMGISQKPKTKFFDYSVTAKNGMIRAVYIPNEYSLPGVLKTANLFITDKGFPDAHFRIHIYSVSPLEIRPNKELTTLNIIASGVTGNEWVRIDLTNQRIVVPENGCFVGIEWFDHPKSVYFRDTLKIEGITLVGGKNKDTTYAHIRSGNGIVLGSRSESYKFAKNKLWYKTPLSEEWVNSTTTDEEKFNVPDTLSNGYVILLNENNTFFKIPCLNIEVSFRKEKVDIYYETPKKRKLNKLERVKEDSFNYPQASVMELFNSLIKAVEKDNIVYILKFLCVYADDELDQILSTIKDKENSTGVYFSESDKKRIIDHFTTIINNLDENSLDKVDSHHFELKVNNDDYNLIIDNGKWKVNPYSYRIMK